MSSEQTKLGLKAVRAGDKREARRIFAAIVRDAPDDAMAWWNLASVTEDLEQKVRCLRQVLRIAPDHDAARRLLATVENQIGRQTPAQGLPRPIAEADAAGSVTTPTAAPEPVAKSPRRDIGVPVAILAALAMIAILGVAYAVLRPRQEPASATPTPPEQTLTIQVEQCITTSGGASLVFSNQSGRSVRLSQGAAGREVEIGVVPSGAQQTIETVPGEQVRYSVKAEDDPTLSGGATIEVPTGSSCSVRIR